MSRAFPKAGSVDVLFVAYGGGHVQMVLPVAKALAARGVRVCVLALTTAVLSIQDQELDYFSFADFPQTGLDEVRRYGQTLAAEMAGDGVLPAAETEAYLGLNFRDLVLTYGAEEAQAQWDRMGRQIFDPYIAMTEMLRAVQPRLLVATNSPRAERAAVNAAVALGVPALVMVDLFAIQEVKWLAQLGYGDKLLVLNNDVARFICGHGRAAQDVVVTGNPGFDGLNEAAVVAEGAQLRQGRGWGAEGRRVILYASGPEPAVHPFTGAAGNTALPERVEAALREMIAARPDLELVIRRHPSEAVEVAAAPRVWSSPRSDDLGAVIHAVDIVVVVVSTVGLQAHLAGKPVISVAGSVFADDTPFAEFGIAESAEIADLPMVIDHALNVDHHRAKYSAMPRAVDAVVAQIMPYVSKTVD